MSASPSNRQRKTFWSRTSIVTGLVGVPLEAWAVTRTLQMSFTATYIPSRHEYFLFVFDQDLIFFLVKPDDDD